MNKTIEQRITHLEHQNQVILKGIEDIKQHLWKSINHSSPNNLVDNNLIEQQEQEAIKYVEGVVIPKSQQSEEIGVKGFWQGAILNYLKQQALNFIGSTLKKLAMEKMIDLADWLLEQLEDYLLQQYQQATEEERRIFKEKMLEKFPNSKLTGKL